MVVVAMLMAIVSLVALTIAVWPPDWLTAILLAALYIFPATAGLAAIARRQSRQSVLGLGPDEIIRLSDEELAEHRYEQLAAAERELELRELRLARRLRASQIVSHDYVDLLEVHPDDEELAGLVANDRELLALIEAESRLAFDRILANRYKAADGVNVTLIAQDVREFVEKVARLYRPDADDVLLETEIELIAKSFSNVSLHLLTVVDGMPLNVKGYNLAKMYSVIRRSVACYGTYKAVRPYMEYGLNTLQFGRLMFGIHPLAVGTSWVAGKLAAQGARLMGERFVERRALQMLNDVIRIIGFETAAIYGGGFQYRDANWVFGAELVNLEIARGDDMAGRDAALKKLCKLVLRNEFDRLFLISQLARHDRIDLSRVSVRGFTTEQERNDIVDELMKHCARTGADLESRPLRRWRNALESSLN